MLISGLKGLKGPGIKFKLGLVEKMFSSLFECGCFQKGFLSIIQTSIYFTIIP